MSAEPIRYWNRERRCDESEQVYGEAAVAWLYETRLGQALADGFLSRGFPSRVYGAYQSSRASRHKIAPFIREFRIPMDEYEDPGFQSFNDFFIRRFRPGARRFEATPKRMPAFCEARYFAYEKADASLSFPVKGKWLTPGALLEDPKLAAPFEGGPMLLARLCPTDYHRFHFPDDGRVLESRTLAGRLHSVNPVALRFRGDILATNERQVTLLETAQFGKLAYVEVGAMMVGKIVQTDPARREFRRGDEKGYFLFGGSTVVVFGEPGRWKPDSDILQQTALRRETYIKLGTGIAASS